MKDSSISLPSDAVISISNTSRLLMGHNTFKVEELQTTLKNHLRVREESPNVNWFQDGAECSVLSPGKDWAKGKVRITVEFIPNEPEISTDQSLLNESLDHSLDNIRQKLASGN